MSKGFRVLLQILQAVCLLGALLFLASSLLLHIADLDLTGFDEGAPIEQWALAFGVLAVALSPALWSLARSGRAAAPSSPAGGFDRVVPPAQQPPQPGGAFEPVNANQAPAPPASSYGQGAPGGFGGPTPPGASPSSPPPAESPWGSGR